MKLPQKLLIGLLIVASVNLAAQTSQQAKSDSYRMKTFIDGLMKKMTLEEKIGQLNLPGAGDITTGQASSSILPKKLKKEKWEVCSILNQWPRSRKCRNLQLKKAV